MLTDAEIIDRWRNEPAPLLPILHALHDRDGHLSDTALRTAARALRNPAPAVQRFVGAAGPEHPDQPFDADDGRPVLGAALGGILLVFGVLGVIALIWG